MKKNKLDPGGFFPEAKRRTIYRNAYGYRVDPNKTVASLADVICEVFNCFNETVYFIPLPRKDFQGQLHELVAHAEKHKLAFIVVKPDTHACLPRGAGWYWGVFRCGAFPVTLPMAFGDMMGKGWKPSAEMLRAVRKGVGHYCHSQ